MATNRESIAEKARKDAQAGRTNQVKHSRAFPGSWQAKAYLEAFDAEMARLQATREQRVPEKSVDLGAVSRQTAGWPHAPRSHIMCLYRDMDKEHSPARYMRLVRAAARMVKRYGVTQATTA